MYLLVWVPTYQNWTIVGLDSHKQAMADYTQLVHKRSLTFEPYLPEYEAWWTPLTPRSRDIVPGSTLDSIQPHSCSLADALQQYDDNLLNA